MGLSGEKAQNKQADTMFASNNAAIDKAGTEDPALKEMREYWKSIVDWDTGKSGPVDVLDLPGSQVDIDLFSKAKVGRDMGRVGRGFGTVGENVNPAFTAALDKEMENERSIEASGDLERVVQGKVAEARGALTGIGAQGDARNQNAAGLRQSLYSTYLNRPREKSLLSQVLGGAQSVFGAAGAAGGFTPLFAGL